MTLRVQHISDPDDARLADYRELTDVALRRRLEPEHGLFMAESEKVIRRAVAAGYRPRSFLMAERWVPSLADLGESTGAPVLTAPEPVLEAVTGYHVHRGALAAMQRRDLPAVGDVVAQADRVLLLEGIVDHTNVGAVFRSAAALGFDAVLVDPTCADPLYRRSVRVSMGTVFAVPWTRCTDWPADLDRLRRTGFTVAALALHPTAQTLPRFAADPPARLVLALGTEGEGLSEAALARVDITVQIPMHAGVDSLNVAAAAAVACYALSREPDRR